MKKAIPILVFALVITLGISAQVTTDPVTAVPDSTVHKKTWFNNFQIRWIPEIYGERVFPFHNRAFSKLPYGMNQYMYPTKAGWGTFGDFNINAPGINNYSYRILGIYYKERVGVEFNAYGYGAAVDPQPFKDYMRSAYPNYYRNDSAELKYNRFSFTGLQVGLAYEMKWNGLIIIPKFLVGFASLRDSGNYWRLKEKGSNNFINYRVERYETSSPLNSYHLQLRVAKRIHLGKGRTSLELGLKTEYVLSAKKPLVMKITEEAYGKPATIDEVNVRTRYQSFAIGLYTTLFVKSRYVNL